VVCNQPVCAYLRSSSNRSSIHAKLDVSGGCTPLPVRCCTPPDNCDVSLRLGDFRNRCQQFMSRLWVGIDLAPGYHRRGGSQPVR
jgi:hypothetical protein